MSGNFVTLTQAEATAADWKKEQAIIIIRTIVNILSASLLTFIYALRQKHVAGSQISQHKLGRHIPAMGITQGPECLEWIT